MKLLTKIAGIGALALVILTGCRKTYITDKEIIAYNELLSTPMVVYTDTAKIKYYAPFTYSVLFPARGKDVTRMSVSKAKPSYLGGRSIKYSHFPEEFSIYNPKDSAMMKRGREDFDKHLHEIDSINNLE